MSIPMEQRVTVSMGKFVEITDIPRATVYEMLKSGKIKSVAIGRKRMILVDSYRELIARAMQEQESCPNGLKPLGRQREKVAAKETVAA